MNTYLLLRLCAVVGATGVVHVVGNGEMTTDQEQQLLSSTRTGRVWGFNDLKGVPPGLPLDVLITRWHLGEYPTAPNAGHARVIRVDGPCQPSPMVCIHIRNFTLFPHCDPLDSVSLREVRDHPSSGMIALGLLQEDTNVTLVNVYGMNFQFQYGFTHSIFEKDMATQCCTKCHFHPTYSTFYFPIRHPKGRWLLQFMGIYLIPLVLLAGALGCTLLGLCACVCRKKPPTRRKEEPCDTPLLLT